MVQIMLVEHGQTLEVKNVVSFRKNLPPAELQNSIDKILQYIGSCGAVKVNLVISATYAANETMIDVEVYVPIDKVISSTVEFIYKPRLYLTNCLKASHKGHPNHLGNTLKKLNEYIVERQLQPISVVFIKNISEVNSVEEILLLEGDIYVSVSMNEI